MMGPPPGRGRGRGRGTPLRPSSALGLVGGAGKDGGSTRKASLLPPRPISAMGSAGDRPFSAKEKANSIPVAWGEEPKQGENQAVQENSVERKGRITRMRANEGETRPFSAIGVTGRRSASPVVGSAGSALRKRPTSALASFSGFALNQPLHPREVLGRGLGTNIGISDKSAEVFADRQLVRRTHTLAQDLMTLSRVASAPIVEQVSQVEEPEEDDAPATWEMEGGEKRVRNITDLTPIEMAELESRFKHDGEDGLAQDEFEEVMAEFTGMQGNMSSQLFCKIDANDDGSVEWDEFLSYIVHEAGARLEDAKAKPGASIEGGVLPAQMAQPKDMVGALCLLGRHRLLATVGMVRRELVFWNLDTYSKVKEVLVPSATEALQYRGRGGMVEVKVTELKAPPQTIAPPKTVAGRSMAYLPSNQGLLYACTGTDSMILQFDCRRFRVREIVIPPFTPSCLCVAWNPGVSRSVSHVEQGSWLLVGDVNGDVACLNCKTHELVGRYHAHDRSVQLGQGSLVNQVLLWPKVGVISCGDDGRVVVADYEFWKIKDYFSDEHLKIVELVLSVVSDAKTKAEQADDASAAHALAQRKLEQFETSGARLAQSSISSSRKNRKGSVVSEKSGPIAFDKLKETVEEAERLVALRKSIAQTRSRMAMELLGGSGGAVGSKAVARGLGGDGALGVVEEAGEGVPGRSEKRGGGAGSRQVEAVLTENADIAKCFEGLGWNRKTKQFDSHPQWALLHSRLDVLRSNLLKEAERKKRPMVLTTGASQTCVAISEKHRSIIAGGKDRIVRIWNPFLSLESLGVEELHGHEARIIQLVVMERQNVLVSAAVDKWMRVWDMTTFQVLQKLYDQFDHRPVDRITSMCHDEINQRIITFGNRARVWRVQERTLQDVAAVVRKGTGLQKKGTKAISSAKDGDGVYEQLEESGWSVVDVRQVAQKLQKEYGAGDVWDVPKNIKLLIGTENDADQGEEEVENSKWLELQAQLDHARATGCKQLVVAVCYSSVFHQLVQVGVHHCTVRNMVNGAQVCRFAISRGHPVTTATLDQSERRLFTGAHDGSVRSWNFNSGVLLCEFSKLNKEITSLLFLQTRRFIHRPLVGAGWDKNVVMWADSADDDAEKLEIKGHTADILCLAVCDRVDNGGREIGARGTLVVSGDSEGTVCFWVASNGRLDHSFSPRFLNPDRDHNIDIDHQKDPDAVNHDSVFSLLHIKGTDTLLVGVGSGEIHVIDVQTCVKQKTIVPEAFQHDSRDNPTENPITAATNANELSLFPQPDPPSSLALDTTGNKLLVGGASGAVQMLRVKSKRPFEITRIRRFQAHWGAVLSIVCSPQSHLWVTSGGDGSSRVWNRYGKPVAVVGDRKAEENWPLWLDPLFSKDPAADQSGKNMARKVSGEGGASVSVQGAEGRTASKAAAGARMSEVEEIPFHIRCPPFIPKTLFSKTDSAHQALAKINEANAREEEEQEEADRDRGEDAEDGGDEDRAGGEDGMYSEACLEVSLAEKKKMADLDKWLSDLMTGTPAFPKSVNLYDILPQGKTPNVMAQRTEDLCLVIEALNKHRVMIKDSFRTYASLALTQVNSLDTMSVTEMRVFLKDNRCSQRVLSKLNGIFSISNRIEKAPDPSAKADATEPGAGELVLAEFLECLVRLAREQIPGKDHLPKKVSLFLQAMARHSKVAARDAAQVSANSEVQKVLKKQHPLLVKVYQKYCSQDRTDDKLATMNLKELFQLMKDCQQMDTKFSISKLASAFIAANACAEAGDDGTWNDWDWELSFDEFIEALVRIVDMKTKTHEGALSEKLEYFIQHSIAKYCL